MLSAFFLDVEFDIGPRSLYSYYISLWRASRENASGPPPFYGRHYFGGQKKEPRIETLPPPPLKQQRADHFDHRQKCSGGISCLPARESERQSANFLIARSSLYMVNSGDVCTFGFLSSVGQIARPGDRPSGIQKLKVQKMTKITTNYHL